MWILYLLALGAIAGEAAAIVALRARGKMWQQQALRLTEDYKTLVGEFREQRSSLEGTIRVLRTQRENQVNVLAELARRKPELASAVFDLGMQSAAAGANRPGPQSEVPGPAPAKPADDPEPKTRLP